MGFWSGSEGRFFNFKSQFCGNKTWLLWLKSPFPKVRQLDRAKISIFAKDLIYITTIKGTFVTNITG